MPISSRRLRSITARPSNVSHRWVEYRLKTIADFKSSNTLIFRFHRHLAHKRPSRGARGGVELNRQARAERSRHSRAEKARIVESRPRPRNRREQSIRQRLEPKSVPAIDLGIDVSDRGNCLHFPPPLIPSRVVPSTLTRPAASNAFGAVARAGLTGKDQIDALSSLESRPRSSDPDNLNQAALMIPRNKFRLRHADRMLGADHFRSAEHCDADIAPVSRLDSNAI